MAQKIWQTRRSLVSFFWGGFFFAHILLFGSVAMADGQGGQQVMGRSPWFDPSDTLEQGPDDREDGGDFYDSDVSTNEIDPSDLDREGDFSGPSSQPKKYFSPSIPKAALPTPPPAPKK